VPVVVVQAADGWPEWLTAVGSLGAGLALPLAFVQLAGLRRDRLQGQVDRVAAWPEAPSLQDRVEDVLVWSVPLRVRNSSELPVFVDSVDFDVRTFGYDTVLAAPEGDPAAAGRYAKKVLGDPERMQMQPGVIAPGAIWGEALEYHQVLATERTEGPRVAIVQIVVTDAAGRRWRRPARGRTRRVYRRGAW
jgi:hypothetical protein